jgi:AcrR family transcriptional regulator
MARKQTISDEALLSAARIVFLKAGVGGSTKDIARRAGVSEATLFKRFGTKADLFFRAMVPQAAESAKAVLKCSAETGEADFLACCMREMLAYFRVAMPFILAMVAHPDFESQDFGDRHPENPARRFSTAIANALAERLGPAGAAADRRGADLHALTALMVSSVHSLALFELLALHDTPDADFDRLIDGMAAILWSGAERRLTDADDA